ncbi:MAG: patatin-like phospholipase family protein, partial [Chloroflexota bacterium]|nr:patatin-like phospholipase family protein [Chloroflexota bacterium]
DLYSFGRGPALLGLQGITNALREFIDEETFADLRIPCALTAVDVESMQEIVLQEGRVLDAVTATIAIPGIFPPKQWGERLLVDGGVLDPVPVEVARSLAPRLPIVAVTLSPPPGEWGELPLPKIFPKTPILQPIARLRVAQAFDVFVRSLDMGMYMLAHTRLELEKPDVIIRPQVGDIGTLDKVDVVDIAARGDAAIEEVLPQLHRAVDWRGKVRRWFT